MSHCLILSKTSTSVSVTDMLTEDNEKFVEFGIGGLCNSCLGESQDILYNHSAHCF